MNNLTPNKFYVVQVDYLDNIDILSVGFDTYEKALEFKVKDSAYNKDAIRKPFIICDFVEDRN